MGFVTNYTGKALVECAGAVAKRRNLGNAVVGYEEIAEETFGAIGRAIISSIIYVELFGTCCCMFILEGGSSFRTTPLPPPAPPPPARTCFKLLIPLRSLEAMIESANFSHSFVHTDPFTPSYSKVPMLSIYLAPRRSSVWAWAVQEPTCSLLPA